MIIKNGLVLLGVSMILVGCGGGGSSTGSIPPIVDAPADTAADTAAADTAPEESTPAETPSGNTVAPVITLNGDAEVFIYVGGIYQEKGATAVDDIDGEVSVYEEGEVDTLTEGTYIVTYTATDSSENRSTEERTITVVVDEVYDLNKTVIDVLVMYSGAVEASGYDLLIPHYMVQANRVQEDSGTGLYYNVVGMEKTSTLVDSNGSYDNLIAVTFDEDIKALAESYNADMVASYKMYGMNDGYCGIAWLNGYQGQDMFVEQSYSLMIADCPSDTTVHELGHNMGLSHSQKQSAGVGKVDPGKYPYSFGHGVQDGFTTIMAYVDSFNSTPVMLHSSPALDCNGEPCGIDEGYEGEADAVKTLIQTREFVSVFR